MPDMDDYELEERKGYEESVRAGHLDDGNIHHYSTHFKSNMKAGDPLRTFLNERGLEIARDLTDLLKQDIILTIRVEKDE